MNGVVAVIGRLLYFAAAMRGHSSIGTRARSVKLPSAGRKIEASPSLTSDQSLPSASTIFGVCVTSTVLVPGCGAVPSNLRKASGLVMFLSGDAADLA